MYPKLNELWKVREGFVMPGRQVRVAKLDPLSCLVTFAFYDSPNNTYTYALQTFLAVYERVS